MILFSVVRGASAVTVDEVSDVFNTGIGNYDFVSGSDSSSSPGQVYEVLTLQSKTAESGTNSMAMSYLYDTLYNGGMRSANILVFGFGLNESGGIGTNSVTIDSLDMTFNRALNPAVTLSLGSDSITVFNYEQGTDTAEARIAVDLGFDFMQEYNGSSTELFEISSNISNTSDGAETYFLSSEYTVVANPEPVSSILFIVGGATLGLRRFWKKFKK